MRRFATFALFALIVPTTAEAQVPRLQFGAGLTAPSGDLADNNDLGYHARASVGLTLPGIPVTIRADGEVHRLAEKAPSTENTDMFSGTVNGMVDLFGIGALGTGGSLYFIGGLGYYSVNPSLAAIAFGADIKKVGAQGGLGITLGALGFGGFVEAKFVNIFVDTGNARYIPISAGIKF